MRQKVFSSGKKKFYAKAKGCEMRALHKGTFPINKSLIDQPFKTLNFNFN